MENASKALIIAGAILLSILIISLGIMIFQQASGVINNNSMDAVAVETFNQQFTQYEGKKVKGANVNALLQKIVSNNLGNTDDTSKQVSVNIPSSNWSGGVANNVGEGKYPTSINDTGKALTGKAYDVSTTPDPNSGYITTVTITVAQ